MNNYQQKPIKSWTVKDTEDYFKDILNKNIKEKLRVITSQDLTDEEDLNLQAVIGQWYQKENLKRKDTMIEDLLKIVNTHTECNDFLLQVYIPIGEDEMCFGLKFDAIARDGIIQIGVGAFQEYILKGLNNYLTNNENAKSMIIIKGFNTNKIIDYKVEEKTIQFYETEAFHFIVENEMLYGVNLEIAARIQEYDFTNNQYLGKEVGAKYIDTHSIVAEMEVDNLMHEVGIQMLNQ